VGLSLGSRETSLDREARSLRGTRFRLLGDDKGMPVVL